jgi:hypothetical protein
LNSLTNVVKDNEIASGNIVQLDQTVSFAVQKQTLLIASIEDPSLKEESSKNFTMSVIDLNDVVLGNTNAFWGLDWAARSEAINQVQKNVDETLFLLAENLLDKVYDYNAISYQNIGNNILYVDSSFKTFVAYSYTGGEQDEV